jgi:acyl-CoA hydrolase
MHIVMPGQTNGHGTVFGGVLLAWMDEAAAMAGMRYARSPVVTAHVHSVDFRAPIREGEAAEVTARLVSVGRTSMRIAVEAYGEDLVAGVRTHCTTAEFVLVAVGPDGRPTPVRREGAAPPG